MQDVELLIFMENVAEFSRRTHELKYELPKHESADIIV